MNTSFETMIQRYKNLVLGKYYGVHFHEIEELFGTRIFFKGSIRPMVEINNTSVAGEVFFSKDDARTTFDCDR